MQIESLHKQTCKNTQTCFGGSSQDKILLWWQTCTQNCEVKTLRGDAVTTGNKAISGKLFYANNHLNSQSESSTFWCSETDCVKKKNCNISFWGSVKQQQQA